MATQTTELSVWVNDAPVFIPNGDREFAIWDNDAPVVDVEETTTPTPVVTARRRATIF